MNIYDLNPANLLYFFGSLVRISCIMVAVPIFSHAAIPGLVKILIAFAVSLVIFPLAYSHVNASTMIDTDSLSQITLMTIKEALVGFTLGFIAKLIFDSMGFAFTFTGMQMGFMFSSLYDHTMEAQTPTVSQFIGVLATLLFVSLDGHHMIIKAISESFAVVPLGQGTITKAAASYMLDTGTQMFLIGLRLAAPVAVVIFIMNIAFGIIARAVPQINVIIVSFTVNILVGFTVLILFMPILDGNITSVTTEMFTRFYGILRFLHG